MITNLKSQRSGLPLMLLALAVLVVELAFLVAVGPQTSATPAGRSAGVEVDRAPDQSADRESVGVEEPAEEAGAPTDQTAQATTEPEATALETATTHTIRAGDNLFALSETLWGDGRLWPIVYYANREDLADPDLLRVGHILSIPYLTAEPITFARSNPSLSAQSHLEAYRAYREIGNGLVAAGIRRRNVRLVRMGRGKEEKARWVLYAAGWFVPGFPDGYADEITEEDLRVLRAYQERFGPPFAEGSPADRPATER